LKGKEPPATRSRGPNMAKERVRELRAKGDSISGKGECDRTVEREARISWSWGKSHFLQEQSRMKEKTISLTKMKKREGVLKNDRKTKIFKMGKVTRKPSRRAADKTVIWSEKMSLEGGHSREAVEQKKAISMKKTRGRIRGGCGERKTTEKGRARARSGRVNRP